jgi:hypothetical protein
MKAWRLIVAASRRVFATSIGGFFNKLIMPATAFPPQSSIV